MYSHTDEHCGWNETVIVATQFVLHKREKDFYGRREKGRIEWAGVHLAVRSRKWNARANGNLNNVCAPSGFRPGKKLEERERKEREKKKRNSMILFFLLARNEEFIRMDN